MKKKHFWHNFMVYHTLRLIMNLLKAMTLSNFSDNFPSSFKLSNFGQNFPTAAKLSNFSETFQLKKKLSNFGRFFPTSLASFQLLVLSNCPFQLHASQLFDWKVQAPTRIGHRDPMTAKILSVLIRSSPGFLKFSRSWYGLVRDFKNFVGPGPVRSEIF